MLDKKKLEDDISDLPRKYIVLITGRGKDYSEAKFRVLENLCNERKLNGIYVSQKTSARKMFAALKKRKINTNKLFFIDATGEDYRDTMRSGRYLHVSPEQISDIAVAIEAWVRSLPRGEKFLFLDDYSALFIYNSLGSIEEFSKFLTDRMRMWGLRDVFISIERKYDLKLLDKIHSICNKIVTAKSIGD